MYDFFRSARTGVLAFLLLFAGAGVALGESGPPEDAYGEIMLLTDALELLRENYLNADQVTYKKLVESALRGMLQELDPFSAYDTAEEFRVNSGELQGRMVGIGVLLSKNTPGMLEVLAVAPDSPAQKAALLAGDWIVAIHGKNVYNLTLDQCSELLLGPVGEKLSLIIERNGETVELDIIRSEYYRGAVPPGGVAVLPGKVGYIRLEGFTVDTGRELDLALNSLVEQGVAALILDLRNNPGGLIDGAIDVCNRFLPEGSEIVSIQGRKNTPVEDIFAIGQTPKFLNLPLEILVDGHSASASEIVAGCLRDHRRAELVGERTFGKGSVQRIYPMANGGALRFTVAEYYTPGQARIHGVGIPPDVEVLAEEDERMFLIGKLLTEPSALSWQYNDKVFYDHCIEKALEQLEIHSGIRNGAELLK